ncbi:hypothetical protein SRABI128_05791 [Microbacterium sp. Bi128]|nr:hypothetical protein SRABI128_05791 [Microbacterium sp. Bi128]
MSPYTVCHSRSSPVPVSVTRISSLSISDPTASSPATDSISSRDTGSASATRFRACRSSGERSSNWRRTTSVSRSPWLFRCRVNNQTPLRRSSVPSFLASSRSPLRSIGLPPEASQRISATFGSTCEPSSPSSISVVCARVSGRRSCRSAMPSNQSCRSGSGSPGRAAAPTSSFAQPAAASSARIPAVASSRSCASSTTSRRGFWVARFCSSRCAHSVLSTASCDVASWTGSPTMKGPRTP